VFAPHATGVLVLAENEHGLLEDIKEFLKDIVPKNRGYWHASDAHAYLRSILFPPDKTIPVVDSHAERGTWQSPVFVETDVPQEEEQFSCRLSKSNEQRGLAQLRDHERPSDNMPLRSLNLFPFDAIRQKQKYSHVGSSEFDASVRVEESFQWEYLVQLAHFACQHTTDSTILLSTLKIRSNSVELSGNKLW